MATTHTDAPGGADRDTGYRAPVTTDQEVGHRADDRIRTHPTQGPTSRRIPGGLSRSRDVRRSTHRWARWLHVYTSMIALVVILFFGITGLTLNHPSWTFGDAIETTTHAGTLPFTVTGDDGSVDFLSVSEYVRDTYGVTGSVDSFDAVAGEGSIAYRNAGYAADLFFDLETGSFELTVEQQGWVGVMNDLHKGRDTGSAWSWVIDAAAVFLVVVALTGLVMQLFLRKRRFSALAWAAGGGVAVVAVALVTLG